MTALLAAHEFEAAIRGTHRLVFRLETLQVYVDPGEADWITAFGRGDAAPPPDPDQDDWDAMIRSMTDAGVLFERVHVVHEPLTEYLRFELCWGYPRSAAAGEGIHIADATPRGWPHGVPHHDFWILDDHMYGAVYRPDGTLLGVEPPRPARLTRAERWRADAMAASVPLCEFVRERPRLAERALAV